MPPHGPQWAPSEPENLGSTSWHIGHLGLRQVWQVTRGAGTRIAILDSGVADVPGLEGRVTWLRPNLSLDGAGDVSGHGTRCAVLAASDDARAPGVAPEADVVSVRVTPSSGDPDPREVLKAFKMLAGQVDVISCSFVLPNADPELADAVRACFNRGAFIVGAAGNTANKPSGFPERMPHVVTVTALDRSDQPLPGLRTGPWLDLSAPGDELVTRDELGNVVGDFGNTSGATPLVAGVAALMLSLIPDRAKRRPLVGHLEQLMKDTALDLGGTGHDSDTGAGRIDPPSLLNAVQSFLSTFPP